MKFFRQMEWTIANMDIHVALTLSGPPDSGGYDEFYEVVVVAGDRSVEFAGHFAEPQTDDSLAQWLYMEIETRLQSATTPLKASSYLN